MSESELWFRYQPDDIVLTGVHRRELDAHGYRYGTDQEQRTFFDFFEQPAEMEAWLDQHEADYRPRWNRRAEEIDLLVSTARAALRETTTAVGLIPTMLEVREQLWDFVSFGWSGPQALGWVCETVLRDLLEQLECDLTLDMLLGGMDSFSFSVTRRLQELGRSLDEAEVLQALRERPLDQVIPGLLEDAPGCQFLARYETLCWETGKTPLSWRQRPPHWSLVQFQSWIDGLGATRAT